jgi:hypothetical protein
MWDSSFFFVSEFSTAETPSVVPAAMDIVLKSYHPFENGFA